MFRNRTTRSNHKLIQAAQSVAKRLPALAESLERRQLLSLTANIEVLTGATGTDPYQAASAIGSAVTIDAGQTLNLDAVGDYLSSNANASTCNNTQGQLDTRFNWNFNDTNAPYNTLTGFNAAHVYDTPGTYTATLTLVEGT